MSATDRHHLGPRDLSVAAVINLMWGLNIISVKMAVEVTAPFAAAGLRQLIVFLVCLPFLRIVPGRMAALLLLGLLSGALFLVFVNYSMLVTDNVAALAIAGQLGVPFSLILGIVFLGERIALPRILGIVLAFGGVALLAFDPGIADEVPGLLLTAGGTLVWAIGALIQRRLVGVSVLTIYAWIGLIGASVMLPLSFALEPGAFLALPALPLKDLSWIVFSAVGSTVIGQGGMAWLLQRHPLSTVIPLTLGAPVVAVGASTLFFHTPLTPVMITGALVTMTGVAILVLRGARAAKARE